jgi:nicotinamidase-related amidase
LLKKYHKQNYKKKQGKLTLEDFESFWQHIVKSTMLPRTAFVIVDVQNDFIDGTLALINCPAKQDGITVVPVINEIIRTVPFNVIAYTLDWHPQDHCSFIENVQMRKIHSKSKIKENFKAYDTVIFEEYPDAEQKLWPAHCVVDSDGAKLHPKLTVIDEKTDSMNRQAVYVKKGSKSDIDSYSAFFDNCKLNETTLHNDLQKHNITDLYVCGLAADVCVGNYRIYLI